MEDLLNALMSPDSMNQSQWLILGMGLLILIASFYFMLRLYRIVKSTGKSTYKPNIGLSSTGYRPNSPSSEEHSEQEKSEE